MTAILFVCLGNICRSPAGEEILRTLGEQANLPHLRVDSCGLGDWHLGSLPDRRMRDAAMKRGYDLTSRAMGFRRQFFADYDYILCADHTILEELRSRAENQADTLKLYLLGDFGKVYKGEPVPDPFHGGDKDFELALDMLEDHCLGFIEHITSK